MQLDPFFVLAVLAALLFSFLNGYVASSSLVATIIGSRALSARQALILASLSEFVGPLMFGAAVASTIGRDFVDTSDLSLVAVLAMLIGAIIWLLVTYSLGLPVSPSHSLVGGIMGAAIAASGWEVIQPTGLMKIVMSLIAAPIIGLVCGWLFMDLVLFLARGASPRISRSFSRAQIVTSALLALSQGSNDAQKTMGVIMMALVVAGIESDFHIPLWVLLVCAVTIALGVAFGGSRTIRTLAAKFFHVRPVHGFATQTVAATVVLLAGPLGAPVSAGQVVSSALVGVGAAERLSKIRWDVFTNILVAWVLTIPASGVVAAVAYLLLSQIR